MAVTVTTAAMMMIVPEKAMSRTLISRGPWVLDDGNICTPILPSKRNRASPS